MKRKSRKKKFKMKNALISLLIMLALAGASYMGWLDELAKDWNTAEGTDYTLYFPTDRYPETGKHIKDAIAAGKSPICTIDREGADQNRKKSLQGVKVKKGYDRDEWPMAMCAEGGSGAHIAYIDPSDNRGAGSWVSNQLEKYPDGSRIAFVIK